MAVNTVTQYLALNVADGSTPQLKRVRGVGTVSNVGPTFGTLDAGGTIQFRQPINRAVFFMGAILAIVGTGVYRSVDGGLFWSLVFTITSLSANTSNKSGLNVVTVNNINYLCFVYLDTSSNLRGGRSTDGVTWVTDGPVTLGFEQDGFQSDTVFNGQLWALGCVGSALGQIVSYTPGMGTSGLVVIPPPSNYATTCMSLAIFNSGLYITGINPVGLARELFKIESTVALVASLGSFTGSPAGDFKPAMLVDGDNLYVFTLKNSNSTWGCFQVDSNYTVTDITSTVIPGGMTGAVGASTSSRVLTFVDTDWAPGTNPPKYLVHSANGLSGTSRSLYAWQGPTLPLVLLDAGGNTAQAFSITKFPTASGFFIVGPPICVIQMVAPSTTESGLVISFILSGPAGASNSQVRLWYGLTNDEYLQRLGTLSSPSDGSLNPANTAVTGLVVDSATVYSFTWLPPSTILGTNGVGNRYKFALEAFV